MDYWTTGMDYWNTGMEYWNGLLAVSHMRTRWERRGLDRRHVPVHSSVPVVHSSSPVIHSSPLNKDSQTIMLPYSSCVGVSRAMATVGPGD